MNPNDYADELAGLAKSGQRYCDEMEIKPATALVPVQTLTRFGSCVLIAQWEARAKQCEETAEQFRAVTKGLVSSYLEKAMAYRACIHDLEKQIEHEKGAGSEVMEGEGCR